MSVIAKRPSLVRATDESFVADRVRQDTQLVCLPLQQLHDAERILAEALADAYASVRHCEQALAWIAAVRGHAAPEATYPASGHHTDADSCPKQMVRDDTCTPKGWTRSTGLTVREAEVLRLIAVGNSNRQIAEMLFLSPRTVERHIANIYLKIHAHSRAEATRYAFRHGLA